MANKSRIVRHSCLNFFSHNRQRHPGPVIVRLSNDLSYRSQCRSCQLCNISINIPLLRATNKARQTNSKNLPGIQRRAARSGDAVCASNFPHRKTTGQRCLSPDIDFNAAIHVLIIHGKLQWLRDEIVTVHLIQRDRQRIHLLQAFDGRWCQSVVIFQIRANVVVQSI
ncbi:hypothetical protein EC142370_01305 [Escherichia coli O145:H34]|nr:hypothetical protein HmCmsJML164_02577 [Escherichia coli]GEE59506.1 hypothetical protein EC142370_01305 [Escherichia coli O145:H34]